MISHTISVPIIPVLRKSRIKKIYQFLATQCCDVDLTFMNYGFAVLDSDEKPLQLQASEERYRHSIQMYRQVLGGISLEHRDVLEIGCGRGGGASYLKRTENPRTMTGLDLNTAAVRLCGTKHKIPGLHFAAGDGETLPFLEESFDVILNVESCHAYESLSSFLTGVFRLLRLDGYFLLADFRATAAIGELRLELYRSGLTLIEEQDISKPAFRALQIEHDKKHGLVLQHSPAELLPLFWEFSGLRGSEVYAGLQDGNVRYLRYKLQKKSKSQSVASTFCNWYAQRRNLRQA